MGVFHVRMLILNHSIVCVWDYVTGCCQGSSDVSCSVDLEFEELVVPMLTFPL